jgi:hypothetical protein
LLPLPALLSLPQREDAAAPLPLLLLYQVECDFTVA